MLFRDHFGEPTLFFGFSELWNFHARGLPPVGYMPQACGNPVLYADATYIRSALAWAIARPDGRRGEFVDDDSVFRCFSRNHFGMDSEERAVWLHETFPRMVRDHLGFRLLFSRAENAWWNAEVARHRFWKWHLDVYRRRRRKPEQVAALLQHAGILLHHGAFHRNRDVVGMVLLHSHAALCDLHNLDHETRQPLPCI
jgi:hypothetical protein